MLSKIKSTMKKSIFRRSLVASVIGISSLTSSAYATFSFGVNSYSSDELVITIAGSSVLSGGPPVTNSFAFFLADTDGTSSFIPSTSGLSVSVDPVLPIALSGSGAELFGIQAIDSFGASGNVLALVFNPSTGSVGTGDSFPSDVEITFSGVGFFDFNEVGGELGLYWGSGTGGPSGGVFQDSQVVPEPASFALGLGFIALFSRVCLIRRRA
jgi:hypothetical protein